MSTRTLTMRSIRELYRLKFEAGLTQQQIARALQISKGVVAKYARLAEVAGLTPARASRRRRSPVLVQSEA